MLVIMSGVKQLNRGDQTVYNFRFVDEDDLQISPVETVTLTGYEIAEEVGAVADTDTLLEAIGKLEARVVAIEEA